MSTFPDYSKYDALGLAGLVKAGEVSPETLLNEAKERLDQVNRRLNAVIHQTDSLPHDLIKNLKKTELFCGVPFLVKDLMLPFKGMPLSNGSRAMKSWVPTENSPMAGRINASGLVTFGKTTCSELGASSLTKSAAFGETLNPWDSNKNAGGSSGGRSVVVATRVVPMAYSSDGGGSIRLPASYCGIFGFKPSRGINRYEDMSKAWGGAVVSHVSTISVRDSAAYLDLVAGHTDKDYSISRPSRQSYLFSATQENRKLRIGLILQAPTGTPVHPACVKAAEVAARLCENLGHSVEPTHWNFDGRALMRAFLTIVMNYTHRDVGNIASLLGVVEKQLELEINTRFLSLTGSGIGPDKVRQALEVWQQAAQKMHDLHQRYDVILTPTVATPPLTGDALDPGAIEKLLMRLLLRTGLARIIVSDKFLESLIDKSLYQTPFTPIANMTGQPAMSVPLHWDENGLPHGAHFMADAEGDRTLFMLARQLESEQPWARRVPVKVV
ncbi:MAG: amidase [Gammaproteobacteria bacterium]|nr:amidase [Gammaproteobacteria bacterium]